MTKKILIIDDDEVFLKTVSDYLSSNSYEIITAKDGKEGLEVIKKEKPDLILVDIMMPNIGGLALLKILKEDKELSHIPALVVSNLSSMDNVNDGIELGARGYIIKSNESLKTIADVVESTIGKV